MSTHFGRTGYRPRAGGKLAASSCCWRFGPPIRYRLVPHRPEARAARMLARSIDHRGRERVAIFGLVALALTPPPPRWRRPRRSRSTYTARAPWRRSTPPLPAVPGRSGWSSTASCARSPSRIDARFVVGRVLRSSRCGVRDLCVRRRSFETTWRVAGCSSAWRDRVTLRIEILIQRFLEDLC